MTLNAAAGSLLGKIAGYVEILAKDPRSTAFVPLAESYRQMGLLDEALEVANRGVKVLPSFSPGYTVLGRIQAQLGNLDAAAASFERALLIDPENLMSLKGLARIRMQQGNGTQALKLVQQAVALKPDDAVALKMLAALGAPSPAVQADAPVQPEPVPAAANPQAEPISTITIAEIYIRQGFLDRALKVYRDLLQADPRNEEIRRKLVELKQRIETQKAAPAPAGASETAAVPAPAAAAATVPEVADKRAAAEGRQLAELTRWLDSISRRRADVQ